MALLFCDNLQEIMAAPKALHQADHSARFLAIGQTFFSGRVTILD